MPLEAVEPVPWVPGVPGPPTWLPLTVTWTSVTVALLCAKTPAPALPFPASPPLGVVVPRASGPPLPPFPPGPVTLPLRVEFVMVTDPPLLAMAPPDDPPWPAPPAPPLPTPTPLPPAPPDPPAPA